MNSSATVTGCDHIERLLDMVAAPTPPVVLPPPPQSFTILSRLQSGTEEVVRLDEAIAYARAALAAYGIVDRHEDAA